VTAHYARILVCLVEGTVLLGFLTVAGKGLGERVGWRCGVRVRCVINLYGGLICEQLEVTWWESRVGHTGRSRALAEEANHGLAALEEDFGCVHCVWGMRLEGAESGPRFGGCSSKLSVSYDGNSWVK
jgi:hypothetical protein